MVAGVEIYKLRKEPNILGKSGVLAVMMVRVVREQRSRVVAEGATAKTANLVHARRVHSLDWLSLLKNVDAVAPDHMPTLDPEGVKSHLLWGILSWHCASFNMDRLRLFGAGGADKHDDDFSAATFPQEVKSCA